MVEVSENKIVWPAVAEPQVGTDAPLTRQLEPGKPVKVFLIDDHQVVREGTRRLLELDGNVAVVGESGSGEDALNNPSLGLADVVFCDIMLPGMDGVETTKKLVEKYPHLRVVILSSFGVKGGAKLYP